MSISKEQKKFDEWVVRELNNSQNPRHMVEALSRVGDTVFGASLAAKAAFEKDTKPEHVLKILELALAERDKMLLEERRHKDALEAAVARKTKS